ncbi:MAG: F0F1 ATP synthase subunit delta [Candidatus Eisenbacteria bacterium]|uniref:ATP synthase subunit delta n=1 Tax=Eiseniibacteriota bacterium TaxID=2212470 RepID=A0A948RX03_UNCEI|nr:F0F1 ATP synthase subunit delta [Candidatus Eisenbacteria bacterium]MBU1949990.1 F0F1 ATP synthase subunit delta [Candidatus Eisenbacteria bacterium]MBU2691093.1 F0F1 ATP synthase subunit delta [Candidatus Eisenbacteria bacterium]
MKEWALARRYAEALFMAALDRGILDPVSEDAGALVKLLESDPRLLRFLESPQILADEKEKVVQKTLREQVQPLLCDFILLLLSKQRVALLLDILDVFKDRVEEHRGIVSAQVFTAVPLPGDMESALRQRLEAKVGLKVRLEKSVDSDVIGGVKVVIGNRVIDGSVQNELRELKQQLLKATL